MVWVRVRVRVRFKMKKKKFEINYISLSVLLVDFTSKKKVERSHEGEKRRISAAKYFFWSACFRTVLNTICCAKY